MRKFNILIAATLLAVAPVQGAIVHLELGNTEPLVDENDTYLQGTASSGYLVQLILAGGVSPAVPNGFGAPSGGDTLMFTTWVGANLPNFLWNLGLVYENPIDLDDSLVGQNFYVRFWNGYTAASSTYYGNSDLFVLPAPDGLDNATVDFAPDENSLHKTIYPFAAAALVVPEPATLFPFGIAFVSIWWLKKTRRKNLADSGV